MENWTERHFAISCEDLSELPATLKQKVTVKIYCLYPVREKKVRGLRVFLEARIYTRRDHPLIDAL